MKGLVNYRPIPNMKFHTYEKISLSFLPPPTGSQGGPVEREAELAAVLLFRAAPHNLNTIHRTRESKVALFCEKFGGICTSVPKNIYMFAYKLFTEVEKKNNTKV